MSNINAIVNGDKGRAYGICQFDYRYDLVRFMNYAYDKHPELWPGFEGFLGFENGDEKLCNNPVIAETFVKAMQTDYETAVCDQLEFVRIHYWDSFKDQMNNAGFNLDGRHIAVSAALLSVKVNCGTQAGTFINNLSPDMTDEEMIRGIYKIPQHNPRGAVCRLGEERHFHQIFKERAADGPGSLIRVHNDRLRGELRRRRGVARKSLRGRGYHH